MKTQDLPKLLSLEDEVIQFVSEQTKVTPIVVIGITLLLAGIASQYLPIWWVMCWVALIFLVLIARRVYLPKLSKNTEILIQKKISILIVVSFLTGMAQALSLFVFPYLSEIERAIQTMMLISLCSGVVSTTIGYRPFVLAYMLPILVALVVLWAWSPGLDLGGMDWLKYSTAGIIVLTCVFLLILAQEMFRLFSNAYDMSKQHALLNQELEVALKDADAANRAKTRFLASASHDLRQPTHALTLLSAALRMQSLDARSQDISDQIHGALNALSGQLSGILDISRLDAGVVGLESDIFSLSSVIRQIVSEFMPVAEEAGVVMELEIDDVYVNTDQTHLSRIIRNLLSNALKYTPEGKVLVTLSKDMNHSADIQICDTGVGIPEKERALIFEEFYQVGNPNRDRGHGLGLGLAIVRRLADLIDVDVTIQSKLGEGTCARIRLPVFNSHVDVMPQIEETPNDQLAEMKILVVDDEQIVRLGMEAVLMTLGAKVRVAVEAQEALRRVAEDKPDIVITDYRLGGEMDGIALILKIRERAPTMPAILISGDIGQEVLHQAKQEQILLLHKPVQMAGLREAVLQEVG